MFLFVSSDGIYLIPIGLHSQLQLEDTIALAFNADEHESAQTKDRVQLRNTLGEFLRPNANILDALHLETNKYFEAVTSLEYVCTVGKHCVPCADIFFW
jgi:hypothetical protein